MSNNTAAQNSLTFPVPSYRQGVILVFIAGLCWSTMGLGIRFMEIANVWQILFYRSIALTLFLFIVITLRSSGRPLQVIRKAGLAGIIGGLGLVDVDASLACLAQDVLLRDFKHGDVLLHQVIDPVPKFGTR